MNKRYFIKVGEMYFCGFEENKMKFIKDDFPGSLSEVFIYWSRAHAKSEAEMLGGEVFDLDENLKAYNLWSTMASVDLSSSNDCSLYINAKTVEELKVKSLQIINNFKNICIAYDEKVTDRKSLIREYIDEIIDKKISSEFIVEPMLIFNTRQAERSVIKVYSKLTGKLISEIFYGTVKNDGDFSIKILEELDRKEGVLHA